MDKFVDLESATPEQKCLLMIVERLEKLETWQDGLIKAANEALLKRDPPVDNRERAAIIGEMQQTIGAMKQRSDAETDDEIRSYFPASVYEHMTDTERTFWRVFPYYASLTPRHTIDKTHCLRLAKILLQFIREGCSDKTHASVIQWVRDVFAKVS